MVTTTKHRIREAPEPSGMISRNHAAKKYHVPGSLLSIWVAKGEVKVAKAAAFPGDTVLLDEASLRKRLQSYTPNKDNRARKPRSRTAPEIQAEAQRNGHTNGVIHGAGTGAVQVMKGASGFTRPAPPTSTTGKPTMVVPAGSHASELPEGVEPVLPMHDWLALYFKAKEKRLSDRTKENYDTVFKLFQRRFEFIPLGAPARGTVLEWVNGLKCQQGKRRGQPITDNSKRNHLTSYTTFYRWLHRSYGYNIPDLGGADLQIERANAVPILPGQARAALAEILNSTESLMILVLGQTGMRVSEYCTIRSRVRPRPLRGAVG